MADIVVQEGNTLTINESSVDLNDGTNTVPVTAVLPEDSNCEKQANIEVYKCYLSTVVTGYTYEVTDQNGTVGSGTLTFGTSPSPLQSGQTITITGVQNSDSNIQVVVDYSPSNSYTYNTYVYDMSIFVTVTDQNGCTLQETIHVSSDTNSGGGGGGDGGPILFP